MESASACTFRNNFFFFAVLKDVGLVQVFFYLNNVLTGTVTVSSLGSSEFVSITNTTIYYVGVNAKHHGLFQKSSGKLACKIFS